MQPQISSNHVLQLWPCGRMPQSLEIQTMNETTAPVNDANPMRKIILMIGVAIFVFLAFTTYSVNKSIQSSSQLSDIRDLFFPVLERVDANIVRLDKMQENYLTAVMTGDEDMVNKPPSCMQKPMRSLQNC